MTDGGLLENSTAKKCNECESKGIVSDLVLTMCNFPLNSSDLGQYVDNIPTCSKKMEIGSHVLSIQKEKNCIATKKRSRTTSVLKSHHTIALLSNSEEKALSSCVEIQDEIYPLWENKETNLCWLDSTLSLLVTNKTLYRNMENFADGTITKTILKKYRTCKEAFRQEESYSSVQNKLENLRQDVWNFLQPKLLLDAGSFDSPLFCLPWLLRNDAKLSELTTLNCKHQFRCQNCGYEKENSIETKVLSIPNCTKDFKIPNQLGFTKSCSKCKTDNQLTTVSFCKLPEMIIIHCLNGFRRKSFWHDYFPWKKPDSKDESFYVSQIIQYTGNHYVLWTYDTNRNIWLKADDLKDPICQFSHREPQISLEEANIVVWEKVQQNTVDIIEKENIANGVDNLTLHSGTSSSSSSSATRYDNLEVVGRPSLMKNWLKHAIPKLPAVSFIEDTNDEHIKKQCDAVKRYRPYITKNNQKNTTDNKSQRNAGLIDGQNSETLSASCEQLPITHEGTDCSRENMLPQVKLKRQRSPGYENILMTSHEKDVLCDSAYSSPISDYNSITESTKTTTAITSFDAAMEIVDDLFKNEIMNETPLSHSLGHIIESEDTYDDFSNEIDITNLL